MKLCPFCAEEIQDEAIKCKHCGEFLNQVQKPKVPDPWYYRTSIVVLAASLVGPLALPLVWINPRYSLLMKILITVVILALSWWTFMFVQQLMVQLKQSLSTFGVSL